MNCLVETIPSTAPPASLSLRAYGAGGGYIEASGPVCRVGAHAGPAVH